MAEGMAIKKGNKVQQIEDLFEFVHLPEEEGEVQVSRSSRIPRTHWIKRLGNNRYEVSSKEGSALLDLNFEGEQLPPLGGLDRGGGKTRGPPAQGLGLLHRASTPKAPPRACSCGSTATGSWSIPPPASAKYLKQVGVAKDSLTAIIQTHVHDDHCALSELHALRAFLHPHVDPGNLRVHRLEGGQHHRRVGGNGQAA